MANMTDQNKTNPNQTNNQGNSPQTPPQQDQNQPVQQNGAGSVWAVPVWQPTAQPATPPAGSTTGQWQQVAATTGTSATGPTPAKQPPQKAIIRTPLNKKGSKITPKAFAFGCLAFFWLIILGIFIAGYYALQNPASLASIGIAAQQAKTILLIIAGAFFGIWFIGWFLFLLINWFRLSKAKNEKKGKYIISMIASFIILTISLVVWWIAITRISEINTEISYSNNLVVWYVYVYEKWDKNATRKEIEEPGITPIGPINVYMGINESFRMTFARLLGVNRATSLSLSCGNGTQTRQSAVLDGNNLIQETASDNNMFQGSCLYMKKWTYNLEANYTYFDAATQQTKSEKFNVGTINIKGEIGLSNDGVNLGTNENNTEVLAWDTPARIIFDAKNIFTDFGYPTNLIVWDLNDDGIDETEKENKTFFSYNYTQAGQHLIRYRIPSNPRYPLYYYTIPLRVIQSDVPVCKISHTANTNGSVSFQASWESGWAEVNNMKYEVYNVTKELTRESVPTTSTNFTYTLPDKDQYVVRLTYTTIEGKKWFCESELLNANHATYQIDAWFDWKKPLDSTYTKVWTNVASEVYIADKTIQSTYAPVDMQVTINNITPRIPEGASVSVLLNNQAMQTVKSNVFTARIYAPNTQAASTQRIRVIVDDGKGNISETTWNIVFNKTSLRWSMVANPITGTEPLVVSFDASSIVPTDTEDEVVYYTWDFGDGQTANNISHAKMEHTYNFMQSASGNIGYQPSVTVQTKKGVKETFLLSTPISVTRKPSEVSISILSHPTQVADVWDVVRFSVSTDWYVKGISWDFGDGSTPRECEYRSCAEITKAYAEEWLYDVRATVSYSDLPAASATIRLKVE